MNAGNGICSPEGMVLIDWDEAHLGCPLFSMARLLREVASPEAREQLWRAYGEVSPHATRDAREAVLRLAPLKWAWEARQYARGLGWSHPHTRFTTRQLMDACGR